MAKDNERISAEIAEQAAREQHRGWIGNEWLYSHATWLAGRVGHDVVAHVLHMAVGSMPFIPETDAWQGHDDHDGEHVVIDDETVVFRCSCGAEADDSMRYHAAERLKQFRLTHGDGAGRTACLIFAVDLIADIWRRVSAAGVDCPPPVSDCLCALADAFERISGDARAMLDGDAAGAVANDDDLVETLVDMARQGLEADFRSLAAATGLSQDRTEDLWLGTLARVGKEGAARAAGTA